MRTQSWVDTGWEMNKYGKSWGRKVKIQCIKSQWINKVFFLKKIHDLPFSQRTESMKSTKTQFATMIYKEFPSVNFSPTIYKVLFSKSVTQDI